MLEIDLSFLSPPCGGVGRPELLGELGLDLVRAVLVLEEVGRGSRPTGRLWLLTKYIQFNRCMQFHIFDSFSQILRPKHEIW